MPASLHYAGREGIHPPDVCSPPEPRGWTDNSQSPPFRPQKRHVHRSIGSICNSVELGVWETHSGTLKHGSHHAVWLANARVALGWSYLFANWYSSLQWCFSRGDTEPVLLHALLLAIRRLKEQSTGRTRFIFNASISTKSVGNRYGSMQSTGKQGFLGPWHVDLR